MEAVAHEQHDCTQVRNSIHGERIPSRIADDLRPMTVIRIALPQLLLVGYKDAILHILALIISH